MLKEVFAALSTNGRWGVSLVANDSAIAFPARGRLDVLGTAQGIKTFKFTPDEGSGTWVLPLMEEVKVHGGATVVHEDSLQSGRHVSIVLLGREAVLEHIGYKGRDRRIVAYKDGSMLDIPAPVLLAMGLIEPEPAQAWERPAVITDPPPLEGAMAEAFRKAFG